MQLFSDAEVFAIAAHPDDEVVSFGVQLVRQPEITVVHVTDGVPDGHPDRAAYRALRQREAAEALAIVGARPPVRLGLTDQRAIHALVALSDTLVDLIPEGAVVVTHPFEGGHPDHDACAFAVARARKRRRFTHVEWTSYHNDGHDRLRSGAFLRAAGTVHRCEATADELATKRAMMAAHASQAKLLSLFDPANECYRLAPAYDFKARPTSRLLYETFGWRLSWADWLAALVAAES